MIKKSIISAKFNRSQFKCLETFLWDKAPNSIKKYFLSKLETTGDQNNILSYYHSDRRNFLLTTERIIGNSPNYFDVALDKIRGVIFMDIMSNKSSKLNNERLTLLLDNEKIDFYVEPVSWPIVYNIIKYAVFKTPTDLQNSKEEE